MEFIFKKERRSFGARVTFEDKDEVVFSENSNPELVKNYILQNPVDRVTQYAGQTSLSVANTERATYKRPRSRPHDFPVKYQFDITLILLQLLLL